MTGELTPIGPDGNATEGGGLPELREDRMDLDLATAAVLARDEDQPMLVTMLADQLSATLGDQVRVERDGGRFRKSPHARALEVTIANDTYRAEVTKGRVACSIGHTSGGIRIRSEQVELDQWVRRLLDGLHAEAARSQKIRTALEGLVYGGFA
jgi:hypothetical protein